ncbi:MAG: hypothetical protein A2W26_00890 [Acidobacteria bacterium RBG_16_64_8]|nr:MAG: hypothetical protein A2W26_00890 [Acidobacteria bacterium RBG_16_64_8]
MLDRERILAKLDALDGYLRELEQIVPTTFDGYRRIETKRACERLLQISIESTIDVCGRLVIGLRLGLPAEETDLFAKLQQAGVVSAEMAAILGRMKGLRNILVHEYGQVNDRVVYEVFRENLGDFVRFRQEVTKALARADPDPT